MEINDTGELSCRHLVELVTDYLEGQMSPEDRARFEEHLAECEGCRAYLDQMRHILTIVGALSEASLVGEPRERLLAAFRDWSSRAKQTGPDRVEE